MAEKKKTSKKKTSKKNVSKKTKKQKVTETYEVTKGNKEKIVKSKGTQEIPKEKKGQSEHQNKILRNFIIGFIIIMAIIAGFYFYTQAQININYKGIEFKAAQIGQGDDSLLLYETKTLMESNDGTNSLFGFRLRTNPRKLKRINFENLDEFKLMRFNGYNYGNNSFDCEGDGVIAMANLQRLFQKTGMQFLQDKNSTCDPEGRYNFFELRYGDKTEIRNIGNNCYEITIKGNDDKCEILPATEKLMAEIYVKYADL